MSRSRAEILADLRQWVETRRVYGDGLLYEALVEVLDPAPIEPTLLGLTQAKWEALMLTDEERDRVRALFEAGPSVETSEFAYVADVRRLAFERAKAES